MFLESTLPVPSIAMQVAPDNSNNPQPYLMPSKSRTNPASDLSIEPLTPIQQFIRYSCESETRNLNAISPSLIIMAYSLCFAMALGKAKNFKTPSFVYFLSPFANMVFYSLWNSPAFYYAVSFLFHSGSRWRIVAKSIPNAFVLFHWTAQFK